VDTAPRRKIKAILGGKYPYISVIDFD